MSESSQSLPVVNPTSSANDAVFSLETRDAAMNVISISEARRQFAKSGMTSQSAFACVRGILGAIGIDLSGSQVEHASDLVRFRAMAAAGNDNTQETKKAA